MKAATPKIFLFFIVLLYSYSAYSQNNIIDSIQKVLQTQKEDTNKVNTLNALSKQLWQVGDYDQARKYGDDALAFARSVSVGGGKGWAKGEANANSNIGAICEKKGNYPEALKNHFAALKIYEKIGSKKGVAICL